MPKAKKLPKAPRINASLAVWQNYEKRVKEVNTYNNNLKKEAAKKQAIIKKLKK
jgi:hypothetical protein